jgi:hypothetical protein
MSDPISTDGDRMFTGVNQRLQLNQLQPGEVRESINGRMDGFWKPRKAVIAKSVGISTGGAPLTVPFFVIDANKTLTATRTTTSLITITTSVAHGLTGSGYATIGDTTLGATAPFSTAGAPPAGSYLMTVTGASTLTFDYVSATTGALATTANAYLNSRLNDFAVSNIFGSCLFSDPGSENSEFILIATNIDVRKISLDTFASTTISLPPNTTIDAECHMLQAFDKVIIFREGKRALQWNGKAGDRFYPMAGGPYSQPATFSTSTTFSGGVVTSTPANLLSMTGSVVGAGGKFVVLPAYFDDGSPASDIEDFYNGAAIQINSNAATTVANYVAATRTIEVTAAQTFTSGTSYTLNSLETSGFTPGDILEVITVPGAVDEIAVGDRFVVATTPLYNKFTFQSPHPSGTHTIHFSYVQSIGGGFSHIPAPPWGTYFQRRLWVPYWYETGGTLLVPTYTDRGTRDEIMASDVLDSDTYDQIMNQFRITGGIADFTVAMQPFYDDALMVLNRNSLHLVAGTQGTLADTVVKELTSEVGCLARKSVVVQGPNVFFLSDNGVYGLTFIEQYNLRGIDTPLSITIQPYIDRINKGIADHSVGIYFNNRYWLAVPLDAADGIPAYGNNTVLIYNFLNKGWESIDTYGDSRFNILNFHIGKSGARNALYIVTATGGLHEVDSVDQDNDELSVDPLESTPSLPAIQSRLVSRGYDLGSMDRKRFTDTQIQMQALDTQSECNLSISFSSQDPDNAELINTTETLIGEKLGDGDTANVRARLGGIRGFTGTVILDRITGSPKVISVAASASLTNRQIISQN